jgi:hypothetical protein
MLDTSKNVVKASVFNENCVNFHMHGRARFTRLLPWNKTYYPEAATSVSEWADFSSTAPLAPPPVPALSLSPLPQKRLTGVCSHCTAAVSASKCRHLPKRRRHEDVKLAGASTHTRYYCGIRNTAAAAEVCWLSFSRWGNIASERYLRWGRRAHRNKTYRVNVSAPCFRDPSYVS